MTDRRSEAQPVTDEEANVLFAGFAALPALLVAVSGGPDSVALMWLLARWRASREVGPQLIAVTVDHGLRPEAAQEARMVKRLAKALALEHHTLRWRGEKPAAGLPAAAREARYALLARLARAHGHVHVATAHTRDDQAETVLMRLARGSGIAGLAAMAPLSTREGLVLVRPLLGIGKARLLATLDAARIGYVLDPTNRDITFTRPRLRELMPLLAREGCDARNLSRLAGRMARANAALDRVTVVAEREMVAISGPESRLETAVFFGVPEEIQLRLLARALARAGNEGPAELAKIEDLLAALRQIAGERLPRLRQTLAGALVSLSPKGLTIAPAPARRPKGKVPS